METLNGLSALILPLLLALTAMWGLYRGADVYGCMTDGAKNGLHVMRNVFPALVTLLPAVYMLRASGAADALAGLLRPVYTLLGIPAETAPLVLLRPITGSGATAIAGEIIAAHGADSTVGRTAAIMLGSSETTFYVTAVYFGAVGVKRSRWAIPAALIADAAGFIAASVAARVFT
jgi:spore maturation protein B